jgi:hypothetical protein
MVKEAFLILTRYVERSFLYEQLIVD